MATDEADGVFGLAETALPAEETFDRRTLSFGGRLFSQLMADRVRHLEAAVSCFPRAVALLTVHLSSADTLSAVEMLSGPPLTLFGMAVPTAEERAAMTRLRLLREPVRAEGKSKGVAGNKAAATPSKPLPPMETWILECGSTVLVRPAHAPEARPRWLYAELAMSGRYCARLSDGSVLVLDRHGMFLWPAGKLLPCGQLGRLGQAHRAFALMHADGRVWPTGPNWIGC
jgi:hypothetical protein